MFVNSGQSVFVYPVKNRLSGNLQTLFVYCAASTFSVNFRKSTDDTNINLLQYIYSNQMRPRVTNISGKHNQTAKQYTPTNVQSNRTIKSRSSSYKLSIIGYIHGLTHYRQSACCCTWSRLFHIALRVVSMKCKEALLPAVLSTISWLIQRCLHCIFNFFLAGRRS